MSKLKTLITVLLTLAVLGLIGWNLADTDAPQPVAP